MTPKEKAEELFKKYIELSGIFVGDYESEKEMCLIAVQFAREFITGDLSESFDKTMYLFEVKQEIENYEYKQ
jgi:hypothetical protein